MQAQRFFRATPHIHIFLTIAASLALLLLVMTPLPGQASSILLRSDPPADKLLLTAPSEVHLWFSEDLNSAASTVMVQNAEHRRVDLRTYASGHELVVPLQSPLPPGVYTVSWRTLASYDGQTLTGAFSFGITGPDGALPQGTNLAGVANAFGATPLASGQLDLASVLYGLMQAILALGATFWVGTLFWRAFITRKQVSAEQQALREREERLFEQKLAQPLLILLLCANIGLLFSNSLALAQGEGAQVIPSAIQLLTTGGFGTYWLLQQFLLIVALLLPAQTTPATDAQYSRSSLVTWGRLALGCALLLLFALSGHGASTTISGSPLLGLGSDWLHWLGTAIWVGGMFYATWVYLPALRDQLPLTQGKALLNTLGTFSPLALTGLLLLLVTGPFSSSLHLQSWEQLLSTPYGCTLIVKCLLLGILLCVGAVQDLLIRPRLNRDYKKIERIQVEAGEETKAHFAADASKKIERQVEHTTRTLHTLLRWEALLGVTLLLASSLMSVYAATTAPAQPASSTGTATKTNKPFQRSMRTEDQQFNVQLTISPNRIGPNTFTVHVLDKQGQNAKNIQVGLAADMVEMRMGATLLTLQPDNKGNFSGTAILPMSGLWQIDVHIRTTDTTQHTASFRIQTS
ncbi:copper transport protein YcnJ [Ktedonobacter sp. SOSP1-52]|uniref:FixH family protein n=1 Tax=Ktedonobacter sp. SOSP1-52 TaxID=2778366 RepID=UPI001915E3B1|nr:FixH family protein [Ktedonobacter sp. SOSP1-52]GHO66286.1 copper transport protein YcnJ [Ktedonobacter sp. SOSP1-52]